MTDHGEQISLSLGEGDVYSRKISHPMGTLDFVEIYSMRPGASIVCPPGRFRIFLRPALATIRQYYSHGRGLYADEDWDGDFVLGVGFGRPPTAWY